MACTPNLQVWDVYHHHCSHATDHC